MSFYGRHGKRIFDLGVALPGLVLVSPLLLGVALVVRKGLGSPVLFRQTRPGRDGVPFDVLKFRTMTDARRPDGSLLSDAERLTDLGKLLRSTSIDELPELINVVKGDMSLIGPRPLLMQYLDRYSPEESRRHEVRPGITGWAAVNGRNAISWQEKFALDVWYVDNLDLLLDLRILIQTVVKVVAREGVSAAGDATMPEFMGSETGANDDG